MNTRPGIITKLILFILNIFSSWVFIWLYCYFGNTGDFEFIFFGKK
jgi:hypothetical protein